MRKASLTGSTLVYRRKLYTSINLEKVFGLRPLDCVLIRYLTYRDLKPEKAKGEGQRPKAKDQRPKAQAILPRSYLPAGTCTWTPG